MVWGQPLPSPPAGETETATAPGWVSPSRVLVALGVVAVVTWVLESLVGLGPGLEVVLVAALGSAVAVRFGRAARRVALITLVVIALSGVGWIELINKAQYGTLALTGAPPLVRWCGTTFKPSGVITSNLSSGTGPRYSKILKTPSGYDVFGVALARHRSCGTSGPIFVGLRAARYAAYDPVTSSPLALAP
ncbi:MAG TPA: hypothetical protein VMU64_12425 [Acidimicrobiales bacterium]|nr:hypothetical protein [Acidimicrobiales bacterium]